MPRIPYSGVPDVSPLPTPPSDYQNIQAPAGAFGAQVAQAGGQLGQDALKASDVYSDLAAQQANTGWMQDVNKVLFGDPAKPGDVGFYGLQGQAAMDARESTLQRINDITSQYGGTLATTRSQMMFNQEARFYRARIEGEVGRHYSEQAQQWGVTVNNDQYQNAIADAALRPEDEDAATHSLATANAARIKALQLRGALPADLSKATPEQLSVANQEQRQTLIDQTEARIRALVPTNPAAAQGLFEKYRAVLSTSKNYDALSQRLQSLGDKAAVDGIVHRIIGQAVPSTGGAPSTVSTQQVASAASANGVDPALANATAAIESHHGANVGQRGDIFQMGPTERASVGGSPNVGTPAQQVESGVKFLAHNKEELTAALGREPTNAEVYLAHQQGAVGATWLLTHPDEPAGKVIGRAAIANNGGDPDAPASQFVSMWRDRYNQTEQQYHGAGFMAPVTQEPQSPMTQPVPGFPTRESLIGRIPDGLSDEQYDRVYAGVNRAYNHMLQATSADRAQVLAQYKGGMAMLQDGRDFNYDEGQIRRLFPTDTADEMIGNLQDSRTIGQQITAVRGMPLSDILTQEAANRSVLGTSTGVAYERQSRLSAAFDKAAAAHIKALGEDPAGYVSTTNPQITQARQAIATETPEQSAALRGQGQPTAAESYASKTLGEQERLGVPADNRHVLDNLGAAQMAQGIVADPEQAPARLKAMQAQWGSAWPAVWKDLATVGKLPVPYQMVGALDNEGDGALLARALGQANKEGVNKPLDDLLDKGATGATRPSQAIRTRVEGSEDIQSYARSMLASGASDQQVQGIVSSIALLGEARSLYHNEVPAAAADHAVESAIGKYEFLPQGGARIPRANADAITDNAQRVVAGLSLAAVQPPAIYGETAKIPGAATANDWLRVVQAAPNWVTVGQSIRLMDNGGRFVRRPGGGFVEVPFSVQAAPKPVLTSPDFPSP